MILLAIPGFFLWGIAYPLYKNVKKWRAEKVKPLIEAKLDEAEKVCEKGHELQLMPPHSRLMPEISIFQKK